MFEKYKYSTKEPATISFTAIQMSHIHINLSFSLGVKLDFG
jgi:hypothetical protein